MTSEIAVESRVPVIVASEAAFTETLFKPIEGRTADGYVVKRGKRFVDVKLWGKAYRINSDLCWCAGTKQADGRIWWSHADLPESFKFSARHDVAQSLSVRSEWVGGRILRYFA